MYEECQHAYLVKVEPGVNANKYYEMKRISPDKFTATYGRVQATAATHTYDIHLWHKKFNEKVAKGYRDQTANLAVVAQTDAALTGKPEVDDFLSLLLSRSRDSFSRSYSVSASAVTEAQVREVQRILNVLTEMAKLISSPDEVYKDILELWHVLPRNLGKNVNDALPKTKEGLISFIAKEQDTIDNAAVQKQFVSTSGTSLLDNLEIVRFERIDAIPDDLLLFMGNSVHKIKRIFEISKPNLDDRFTQHVNSRLNKTCKLRYHGTQYQNGMPILKTGLRILGSKSATYSGSMAGTAIYLSKTWEKSRNYSDGLMFIIEAHTGNELNVTHVNDVRHYTYEEIIGRGFDSVNFEAGTYTGRVTLNYHEQTIYNEAQHRIKYVIEAE